MKRNFKDLFPWYVWHFSACKESEQVVSRHSSEELAEKAKAKYDRQLAKRYPSGGGTSLLCNYEVKGGPYGG